MYKRGGAYSGRVPLAELASRLDSFEVAWCSAPGNYGTTTDHLEAVKAAYQGDVGDSLPGVWHRSMLVVLPQNGFIPMHADVPTAEGLERYHLVLQTNKHCWSYHAGEWQQLELGGIYSVNPTLDHASINFGDTPRVHLVVDVIRE